MADIGESKTLKVVSGDKIVPLTLREISKKTLERVLEHLQEEDELFDYNVPEKWRDSSKDGLQEFLVRTYSPKNFEITGEDVVKRYIKVHDFVVFNGSSDDFKYDFYLKPGMKGVIKSVNLDQEYPITALWESCDESPEEKIINHTGEGMSLLPKGIFRREKISSRVELLAEAAPGRLLEPIEISFEYLYYLPVGTRGIVTKIDKSVKLPVSVVFGNTEGYISPPEGTIICTYGCLKLFRENRMNIRKLISDLS